MSLQNDHLFNPGEEETEFKHARRSGRRPATRRTTRRRRAAGIAGLLGAGVAAALGLRSRALGRIAKVGYRKLRKAKGVKRAIRGSSVARRGTRSLVRKASSRISSAIKSTYQRLRKLKGVKRAIRGASITRRAVRRTVRRRRS